MVALGTYRWVGRSIIAVGVIHCVVGVMIFIAPLMEILRDGIWNAVDGFKGRPLAFWFEFAGLLTIVFGLAIDRMEKESIAMPRVMAYGFSILVALAIIAMPVGGGWLLMPAAMGMLLKRQRGQGHAAV